MRLYRAAWVEDGWQRRGRQRPGHPLYVARARQGAGRFDNPSHYAALYASQQPDGAVGEILGNHTRVRAAMFAWAGRPELRRCLVTLEVADPVLLDLDDAEVLSRLGLRPSDVVRRNRDVTRRLALRRYLAREESGELGLAWWSYHHPDWRQVMLWSRDEDAWFPHVEVVDTQDLGIDHPDVVVAAETLRRPIVR
jgi:hypothetical protein